LIDIHECVKDGRKEGRKDERKEEWTKGRKEGRRKWMRASAWESARARETERKSYVDY